MHRRRAAIGEQHEIARVAAAVDRAAPHQIGHMGVDDAERAGGDAHPVCTHRIGEFVRRALRCGEVEAHAPAEECRRVEEAEDQIDIGHRQPRPAAAVAGRSRIGPGAVGPDAEQPVLVAPDDAAAAGADRADRDLGHQIGVFVDHRLLVEHRFSALDHRDVEGGAAHIGAEDVGLAVSRAEKPRAEDAADRAGIEHQQRAAAHVLHRRQPAHRMGEQERRPVALGAEKRGQALQIVDHPGPDIGVHHRRHRALVLAQHRRELGRDGDVDFGMVARDAVAHPALVVAVEERPQEADRDRARAVGDQRVDRPCRLVVVHRDDHVAGAVEALGDAPDHPAVDDRRLRLVEMRLVDHLALGLAGDLLHHLADGDRVLMPLGGDQPGGDALALDHRVGRDGAAVDQMTAVGEQPGRVGPQRLRGDADGIEHALGRIVPRARRLGGGDDATVRVEHRAVGERASDVDADIVVHRLSPIRTAWLL